MSAHYGTEKKRITHEIESRVGRVRRENKEKLREKLAKGIGCIKTSTERVER